MQRVTTDRFEEQCTIQLTQAVGEKGRERGGYLEGRCLRSQGTLDGPGEGLNSAHGVYDESLNLNM